MDLNLASTIRPCLVHGDDCACDEITNSLSRVAVSDSVSPFSGFPDLGSLSFEVLSESYSDHVNKPCDTIDRGLPDVEVSGPPSPPPAPFASVPSSPLGVLTPPPSDLSYSIDSDESDSDVMESSETLPDITHTVCSCKCRDGNCMDTTIDEMVKRVNYMFSGDFTFSDFPIALLSASTESISVGGVPMTVDVGAQMCLAPVVDITLAGTKIGMNVNVGQFRLDHVDVSMLNAPRLVMVSDKSNMLAVDTLLHYGVLKATGFGVSETQEYNFDSGKLEWHMSLTLCGGLWGQLYVVDDFVVSRLMSILGSSVGSRTDVSNDYHVCVLTGTTPSFPLFDSGYMVMTDMFVTRYANALGTKTCYDDSVELSSKISDGLQMVWSCSRGDDEIIAKFVTTDKENVERFTPLCTHAWSMYDVGEDRRSFPTSFGPRRHPRFTSKQASRGICRSYEKTGSCAKRSGCKYVHSSSPTGNGRTVSLPVASPSASPCFTKRNQGSCNDPKCRFDHSITKSVQKPQGFQPCYNKQRTGRCNTLGCVYDHSVAVRPRSCSLFAKSAYCSGNCGLDHVYGGVKFDLVDVPRSDRTCFKFSRDNVCDQENCQFKHFTSGDASLLVPFSKVKRVLKECFKCKESGYCPDTACPFRHVYKGVELPYDFVPTRAGLCRSYQKHGKCDRHDWCPYRHVVDGTMVTFDAVPKMAENDCCLSFLEHGYCTNVDDCGCEHIRDGVKWDVLDVPKFKGTCRTFDTKGVCEKRISQDGQCSFRHISDGELIPLSKVSKRLAGCTGFSASGYCHKGVECDYGHYDRSERFVAAELAGRKNVCSKFLLSGECDGWCKYEHYAYNGDFVGYGVCSAEEATRGMSRRKTKLCPRFLTDDCPMSCEQCPYAHGPDDLRDCYGKLMCCSSQFRIAFCRNVDCKYRVDGNCWFAHSERELRCPYLFSPGCDDSCGLYHSPAARAWLASCAEVTVGPDQTAAVRRRKKKRDKDKRSGFPGVESPGSSVLETPPSTSEIIVPQSAQSLTPSFVCNEIDFPALSRADGCSDYSSTSGSEIGPSVSQCGSVTDNPDLETTSSSITGSDSGFDVLEGVFTKSRLHFTSCDCDGTPLAWDATGGLELISDDVGLSVEACCTMLSCPHGFKLRLSSACVDKMSVYVRVNTFNKGPILYHNGSIALTSLVDYLIPVRVNELFAMELVFVKKLDPACILGTCRVLDFNLDVACPKVEGDGSDWVWFADEDDRIHVNLRSHSFVDALHVSKCGRVLDDSFVPKCVDVVLPANVECSEHVYNVIQKCLSLDRYVLSGSDDPSVPGTLGVYVEVSHIGLALHVTEFVTDSSGVLVPIERWVAIDQGCVERRFVDKPCMYLVPKYVYLWDNYIGDSDNLKCVVVHNNSDVLKPPVLSDLHDPTALSTYLTLAMSDSPQNGVSTWELCRFGSSGLVNSNNGFVFCYGESLTGDDGSGVSTCVGIEKNYSRKKAFAVSGIRPCKTARLNLLCGKLDVLFNLNELPDVPFEANDNFVVSSDVRVGIPCFVTLHPRLPHVITETHVDLNGHEVVSELISCNNQLGRVFSFVPASVGDYSWSCRLADDSVCTGEVFVNDKIPLNREGPVSDSNPDSVTSHVVSVDLVPESKLSVQDSSPHGPTVSDAKLCEVSDGAVSSEGVGGYHGRVVGRQRRKKKNRSRRSKVKTGPVDAVISHNPVTVITNTNQCGPVMATVYGFPIPCTPSNSSIIHGYLSSIPGILRVCEPESFQVDVELRDAYVVTDIRNFFSADPFELSFDGSIHSLTLSIVLTCDEPVRTLPDSDNCFVAHSDGSVSCSVMKVLGTHCVPGVVSAPRIIALLVCNDGRCDWTAGIVKLMCVSLLGGRDGKDSVPFPARTFGSINIARPLHIPLLKRNAVGVLYFSTPCVSGVCSQHGDLSPLSQNDGLFRSFFKSFWGGPPGVRNGRVNGSFKLQTRSGVNVTPSGYDKLISLPCSGVAPLADAFQCIRGLIFSLNIPSLLNDDEWLSVVSMPIDEDSCRCPSCTKMDDFNAADFVAPITDRFAAKVVGSVIVSGTVDVDHVREEVCPPSGSPDSGVVTSLPMVEVANLIDFAIEPSCKVPALCSVPISTELPAILDTPIDGVVTVPLTPDLVPPPVAPPIEQHDADSSNIYSTFMASGVKLTPGSSGGAGDGGGESGDSGDDSDGEIVACVVCGGPPVYICPSCAIKGNGYFCDGCVVIFHSHRMRKNHVYHTFTHTDVSVDQTPSCVSEVMPVTDCSISVISDVTIVDGTHLQPGTKFVKTWRVRNVGDSPWSSDIVLRPTGFGSISTLVSEVPVPRVEPGCEVDISLTMTAPIEPGVYQRHVQLFCGGRAIGATFWCSIVVDPLVSDVPSDCPDTFFSFVPDNVPCDASDDSSDVDSVVIGHDTLLHDRPLPSSPSACVVGVGVESVVGSVGIAVDGLAPPGDAVETLDVDSLPDAASKTPVVSVEPECSPIDINGPCVKSFSDIPPPPSTPPPELPRQNSESECCSVDKSFLDDDVWFDRPLVDVMRDVMLSYGLIPVYSGDADNIDGVTVANVVMDGCIYSKSTHAFCVLHKILKCIGNNVGPNGVHLTGSRSVCLHASDSDVDIGLVFINDRDVGLVDSGDRYKVEPTAKLAGSRKTSPFNTLVDPSVVINRFNATVLAAVNECTSADGVSFAGYSRHGTSLRISIAVGGNKLNVDFTPFFIFNHVVSHKSVHPDTVSLPLLVYCTSTFIVRRLGTGHAWVRSRVFDELYELKSFGFNFGDSVLCKKLATLRSTVSSVPCHLWRVVLLCLFREGYSLSDLNVKIFFSRMIDFIISMHEPLCTFNYSLAYSCSTHIDCYNKCGWFREIMTVVTRDDCTPHSRFGELGFDANILKCSRSFVNLKLLDILALPLPLSFVYRNVGLETSSFFNALMSICYLELAVFHDCSALGFSSGDCRTLRSKGFPDEWDGTFARGIKLGNCTVDEANAIWNVISKNLGLQTVSSVLEDPGLVPIFTNVFETLLYSVSKRHTGMIDVLKTLDLALLNVQLPPCMSGLETIICDGFALLLRRINFQSDPSRRVLNKCKSLLSTVVKGRVIDLGARTACFDYKTVAPCYNDRYIVVLPHNVTSGCNFKGSVICKSFDDLGSTISKFDTVVSHLALHHSDGRAIDSWLSSSCTLGILYLPVNDHLSPFGSDVSTTVTARSADLRVHPKCLGSIADLMSSHRLPFSKEFRLGDRELNFLSNFYLFSSDKSILLSTKVIFLDVPYTFVNGSVSVSFANADLEQFGTDRVFIHYGLSGPIGSRDRNIALGFLERFKSSTIEVKEIPLNALVNHSSCGNVYGIDTPLYMMLNDFIHHGVSPCTGITDLVVLVPFNHKDPAAVDSFQICLESLIASSNHISFGENGLCASMLDGSMFPIVDVSGSGILSQFVPDDLRVTVLIPLVDSNASRNFSSWVDLNKDAFHDALSARVFSVSNHPCDFEGNNIVLHPTDVSVTSITSNVVVVNDICSDICFIENCVTSTVLGVLKVEMTFNSRYFGSLDVLESVRTFWYDGFAFSCGCGSTMLGPVDCYAYLGVSFDSKRFGEVIDSCTMEAAADARGSDIGVTHVGDVYSTVASSVDTDVVEPVEAVTSKDSEGTHYWWEDHICGYMPRSIWLFTFYGPRDVVIPGFLFRMYWWLLVFFFWFWTYERKDRKILVSQNRTTPVYSGVNAYIGRRVEGIYTDYIGGDDRLDTSSYLVNRSWTRVFVGTIRLGRYVVRWVPPGYILRIWDLMLKTRSNKCFSDMYESLGTFVTGGVHISMINRASKCTPADHPKCMGSKCVKRLIVLIDNRDGFMNGGNMLACYIFIFAVLRFLALFVNDLSSGYVFPLFHNIDFLFWIVGLCISMMFLGARLGLLTCGLFVFFFLNLGIYGVLALGFFWFSFLLVFTIYCFLSVSPTWMGLSQSVRECKLNVRGYELAVGKLFSAWQFLIIGTGVLALCNVVHTSVTMFSYGVYQPWYQKIFVHLGLIPTLDVYQSYGTLAEVCGVSALSLCRLMSPVGYQDLAHLRVFLSGQKMLATLCFHTPITFVYFLVFSMLQRIVHLPQVLCDFLYILVLIFEFLFYLWLLSGRCCGNYNRKVRDGSKTCCGECLIRTSNGRNPVADIYVKGHRVFTGTLNSRLCRTHSFPCIGGDELHAMSWFHAQYWTRCFNLKVSSLTGVDIPPPLSIAKGDLVDCTCTDPGVSASFDYVSSIGTRANTMIPKRTPFVTTCTMAEVAWYELCNHVPLHVCRPSESYVKSQIGSHKSDCSEDALGGYGLVTITSSSGTSVPAKVLEVLGIVRGLACVDTYLKAINAIVIDDVSASGSNAPVDFILPHEIFFRLDKDKVIAFKNLLSDSNITLKASTCATDSLIRSYGIGSNIPTGLRFWSGGVPTVIGKPPRVLDLYTQTLSLGANAGSSAVSDIVNGAACSDTFANSIILVNTTFRSNFNNKFSRAVSESWQTFYGHLRPAMSVYIANFVLCVAIVALYLFTVVYSGDRCVYFGISDNLKHGTPTRPSCLYGAVFDYESQYAIPCPGNKIVSSSVRLGYSVYRSVHGLCFGKHRTLDTHYTTCGVSYHPVDFGREVVTTCANQRNRAVYEVHPSFIRFFDFTLFFLRAGVEYLGPLYNGIVHTPVLCIAQSVYISEPYCTSVVGGPLFGFGFHWLAVFLTVLYVTLLRYYIRLYRVFKHHTGTVILIVGVWLSSSFVMIFSYPLGVSWLLLCCILGFMYSYLFGVYVLMLLSLAINWILWLFCVACLIIFAGYWSCFKSGKAVQILDGKIHFCSQNFTDIAACPFPLDRGVALNILAATGLGIEDMIAYASRGGPDCVLAQKILDVLNRDSGEALIYLPKPFKVLNSLSNSISYANQSLRLAGFFKKSWLDRVVEVVALAGSDDNYRIWARATGTICATDTLGHVGPLINAHCDLLNMAHPAFVVASVRHVLADTDTSVTKPKSNITYCIKYEGVYYVCTYLVVGYSVFFVPTHRDLRKKCESVRNHSLLPESSSFDKVCHENSAKGILDIGLRLVSSLEELYGVNLTCVLQRDGQFVCASSFVLESGHLLSVHSIAGDSGTPIFAPDGVVFLLQGQCRTVGQETVVTNLIGDCLMTFYEDGMSGSVSPPVYNWRQFVETHGKLVDSSWSLPHKSSEQLNEYYGVVSTQFSGVPKLSELSDVEFRLMFRYNEDSGFVNPAIYMEPLCVDRKHADPVLNSTVFNNESVAYDSYVSKPVALDAQISNTWDKRVYVPIISSFLGRFHTSDVLFIFMACCCVILRSEPWYSVVWFFFFRMALRCMLMYRPVGRFFKNFFWTLQPFGVFGNFYLFDVLFAANVVNGIVYLKQGTDVDMGAVEWYVTRAGLFFGLNFELRHWLGPFFLITVGQIFILGLHLYHNFVRTICEGLGLFFLTAVLFYNLQYIPSGSPYYFYTEPSVLFFFVFFTVSTVMVSDLPMLTFVLLLLRMYDLFAVGVFVVIIFQSRLTPMLVRVIVSPFLRHRLYILRSVYDRFFFTYGYPPSYFDVLFASWQSEIRAGSAILYVPQRDGVSDSTDSDDSDTSLDHASDIITHATVVPEPRVSILPVKSGDSAVCGSGDVSCVIMSETRMTSSSVPITTTDWWSKWLHSRRSSNTALQRAVSQMWVKVSDEIPVTLSDLDGLMSKVLELQDVTSNGCQSLVSNDIEALNQFVLNCPDRGNLVKLLDRCIVNEVNHCQRVRTVQSVIGQVPVHDHSKSVGICAVNMLLYEIKPLLTGVESSQFEDFLDGCSGFLRTISSYHVHSESHHPEYYVGKGYGFSHGALIEAMVDRLDRNWFKSGNVDLKTIKHDLLGKFVPIYGECPFRGCSGGALCEHNTLLRTNYQRLINNSLSHCVDLYDSYVKGNVDADDFVRVTETLNESLRGFYKCPLDPLCVSHDYAICFLMGLALRAADSPVDINRIIAACHQDGALHVLVPFVVKSLELLAGGDGVFGSVDLHDLSERHTVGTLLDRYVETFKASCKAVDDEDLLQHHIWAIRTRLHSLIQVEEQVLDSANSAVGCTTQTLSAVYTVKQKIEVLQKELDALPDGAPGIKGLRKQLNMLKSRLEVLNSLERKIHRHMRQTENEALCEDKQKNVYDDILRVWSILYNRCKSAALLNLSNPSSGIVALEASRVISSASLCTPVTHKIFEYNTDRAPGDLNTYYKLIVDDVEFIAYDFLDSFSEPVTPIVDPCLCVGLSETVFGAINSPLVIPSDAKYPITFHFVAMSSHKVSVDEHLSIGYYDHGILLECSPVSGGVVLRKRNGDLLALEATGKEDRVQGFDADKCNSFLLICGYRLRTVGDITSYYKSMVDVLEKYRVVEADEVSSMTRGRVVVQDQLSPLYNENTCEFEPQLVRISSVPFGPHQALSDTPQIANGFVTHYAIEFCHDPKCRVSGEDDQYNHKCALSKKYIQIPRSIKPCDAQDFYDSYKICGCNKYVCSKCYNDQPDNMSSSVLNSRFSQQALNF